MDTNLSPYLAIHRNAVLHAVDSRSSKQRILLNSRLFFSSMATNDSNSAHWKPRAYVWDGGFMGIGRSAGVVPPHSHHAFQISLALDGEIRLAGEDGGENLSVCLALNNDPYSASGPLLYVYLQVPTNMADSSPAELKTNATDPKEVEDSLVWSTRCYEPED